jgi:hypothetical protein
VDVVSYPLIENVFGDDIQTNVEVLMASQTTKVFLPLAK